MPKKTVKNMAATSADAKKVASGMPASSRRQKKHNRLEKNKTGFGRYGPSSEMIAASLKTTPKRKAAYSKILEKTAKTNKRTTQCKEVAVSADGQCHTPQNKTPLYHNYTNNVFNIYTGVEKESKRASVGQTKFDLSIIRKLPTPPKVSVKYQEHEFDTKVLNQVQRQKERNNGQRIPTQNVVMNGVPAVDAARAYGLDLNEGLGWEWLHLVAHSMRGDKGQIADNLVLGTKECNTMMMALEGYLGGKAIKEGIKIAIKVEADLYELPIDGVNLEVTHIARSVRYNVSYTKEEVINNQVVVKHIDECISFDPLLRYRPPEEFPDVFAAFFQVAEEHYEKGSLTKKPVQDPSNNNSAVPSKVVKRLDFNTDASTIEPRLNSYSLSNVQTYVSQVFSAWRNFANFFSAPTDENAGSDPNNGGPNNNNTMQLS